MDLVAGIALYKYVMPCHDCGIYPKHLWTLYHDACETICLQHCTCILCTYGLWPEIKSYYYYYYYCMNPHPCFRAPLVLVKKTIKKILPAHLDRCNSDVIIGGDFNIDLLKTNS